MRFLRKGISWNLRTPKLTESVPFHLETEQRNLNRGIAIPQTVSARPKSIVEQFKEKTFELTVPRYEFNLVKSHHIRRSPVLYTKSRARVKHAPGEENSYNRVHRVCSIVCLLYQLILANPHAQIHTLYCRAVRKRINAPCPF